MDTTTRFVELFAGSTSAYGEWFPDRVPPAVTRHSQPLHSNFQAHLDGTVGLGIVPVNKEGLSSFAAIDIDVDTIDHSRLYDEVGRLGLPLTVCRSKSGGAHLYLFMKSPGLSAAHIQKVLGDWAKKLGYPTSEIFPKQKRVSAENDGSWINLPYFGGDKTTRYAVGPKGAMSLKEFVEGVPLYGGQPIAESNVVPESGAILPPCLAKLREVGIIEGYRNNSLFNFAVFYRKSSPENWQALVTQQNSQYFSPPLDFREAAGVIQSASRNKYQYTCDQQPIASFCDREACVKLPFGVGHMPWDEDAEFDELDAKNCRKLTTDPPRYILEINGFDITLLWEELYSFVKFRSKLGQMLNLIIAPRKQASWEQTLRALIVSKIDIDAPEDASMMGLVVDKLHEFLVLRERATEREDILRGLPVQEGNDVIFRAVDFKRYLQAFKLDRVEGADLFLVVRAQGAHHKRIRLNGRLIGVWSYPLKHVEEQTQEFGVPDFAKDFESEV